MFDPHDVNRIAVESYRDPRTVRRVYSGQPVSALARASVSAAALRLGYPPPEVAPASTNAKSSQPAKEGSSSQNDEHEKRSTGSVSAQPDRTAT